MLGLLDLHLVGRHLLAGAPVEQADLVGAEAQRRARAVDGGVAAADHQHAAGQLVGAAQAVLAQELDAGQHARRVLVLDPHLRAVPGADAEEDGVVAVLLQAGDGEVLAEGHVGATA